MAKANRIPCEAVTSDVYHRVQRGAWNNPEYDGKCKRRALYVIAGKNLCAPHAGATLLGAAVAAGQAKVIEGLGSQPGSFSPDEKSEHEATA